MSSFMKKRLKLIDMVEKQKIGVTKAARKLRLKTATAKVILSSYRKKGVIFQKKKEYTVEATVVSHIEMQQ
jgi:DNA-binding IclR family transcriptional regulator